MVRLQLREFSVEWYDCLVLQSTELKSLVYKLIPLG